MRWIKPAPPPIRPVGNRSRREVQTTRKKSAEGLTYRALLHRYCVEHLASKRTRKRIERQLRRVGRTYGWNDKAVTITRADAVALLHGFATTASARCRRPPRARAPSSPRVRLGHLSRSCTRQSVPRFAATGNPAGKPDAVLTDNEIARVWQALDDERWHCR